VYWYLIRHAAAEPGGPAGALLLALLDRSATNAPLAALCLLPLGPALSAALFALRDRPKAEDMTPAHSFWRGYRLNAFDVLRLWTPALIVLAVIAVSLANLDVAGAPDGYAGVLVVIAVRR
jgi:hypothetical protein